jgi:DNA-binding transcriptional MerR regulator/methylmalonyl-CoA mutase cobalamin-binding subunit
MTGLSKEGLRVWEKRYRLVSPKRGPNRYRLYSEEDVKLLNYLVREIEMGQSIGELASLGKDEILARMNNDVALEPETDHHETDPLIKELEKFLMPLDQLAFEQRLREIIGLMPFEEIFKRVLVPLQIRIGELWFDEKVSISVEHYVTTQVKQKLFAVMNMMGTQKGPKVIIACPPWELHEIGAQMVAYHCSKIGCQTTLLGANLPLEDLIHFCTNTTPDALILSFTSSVSENKSRVLFAEIATHILSLCPVVVGGQGINQWEHNINNKNIKVVGSLNDLEFYFKKLLNLS